MKRKTALFRILVLLPAISLAANSGIADEITQNVKLHFNWPADLAGTIHGQYVNYQTIGKENDRQKYSVRQAIETEQNPDGLLVSFEVSDAELQDVKDQSLFKEFMEEFGADHLIGKFSMLLSPEGELLNLVDLEERLTNIRNSFEQLISQEEDHLSIEALNSTLEEIESEFSTSRIFYESKYEWEKNVKQWIGLTLQLHKTQNFTSTVIFPFYGGIELESNDEITFAGWVPCQTGAEQSQCVELDFHSEISSSSIELVKKMTNTVRGEIPKSVSSDIWIRLIADPDSLLPYYLSKKSVSRIKSESGGTLLSVLENVSERYEYN